MTRPPSCSASPFQGDRTILVSNGLHFDFSGRIIGILNYSPPEVHIMSIQEMGPESKSPRRQWISRRKRKRIIVKLLVGCLAIAVAGFMIIFATNQLQDMNDRAH